MDEVVANIKDELGTSYIRLGETASAGRQCGELAGQLNRDAGPLQQQPHPALGG
jgi:hypothetical protein